MESFEDLNDGRALLDIVSRVGEAVLDAAAATTGAQRVRAVLLFLASKYGASLPKSNNKPLQLPLDCLLLLLLLLLLLGAGHCRCVLMALR